MQSDVTRYYLKTCYWFIRTAALAMIFRAYVWPEAKPIVWTLLKTLAGRDWGAE